MVCRRGGSGLVGFDDLLHQTVTHHVFFGEVALRDAVHAFEDLKCIHKAAAGAVGKVDLSDVAGNDHFRADAHAGEEHLHLLRGGVLRFVEDDEGIVQRPAAHIGQRCNLDDLLFHQTLIGLCAQHIEQAVVQRPQIGVYLLLQVTRQKAQLLACLHRRAGQHDAGDIFGLERLDSHGHSKVGLAGTRRADAKGDGVVPDGVEVLFLAQGLGTDGPAFDRHRHEVFGQLSDALFLAVMRKAQAVAHRLVFQRRMVLDKEKHPLHRTGRSCNIGRFARNAQHRTAAHRRHRKFFLQHTDVPVTVPEYSGCDLYAV